MSNDKLVYTKQAKKYARKVASSGLKPRTEILLEIIKEDPFEEYPPYEKLAGNLEGLIPAESTYNTAWCIRYMRKRKL